MEAMAYAETIVKEFLIFRGFVQTVKSFEGDLASDPVQGFQVDRIVDLVFKTYVPGFEAASLFSLLKVLNERFFSRMDSQFASTVVKFKNALQRYYIVHAVQKGRMDRVVAFFEEHGETLLDAGEDWPFWFAIPYLNNPGAHSRLQPYFTKEWLDALVVSFRNFLCLVFDNLRLPTMLRFNAERVKRRAMEDELHTLRSDCARLRAQLASRDSDIAELQSLVTSLQLQGAARGDDSSTAAIPSAAAAAAAAAPPNHAAGGRVPERTSASSAHGAEAPQTSEEHEGATPGKARPLYNNAPPETASSSPAGGKGPSTAHPLHGGRGDRQGGYGGGGSGGGGHSSPPPPPQPRVDLFFTSPQP